MTSVSTLRHYKDKTNVNADKYKTKEITSEWKYEINEMRKVEKITESESYLRVSIKISN